MSKLIAKDATVVYERRGKRFLALQEVSLAVEAGEFVAIVGPSGCGKSTFLMAVDGLIPLAAGKMELDGVEIKGASPNRAVVFQDASLLPWRTTLSNISFGMELSGKTGSNAQREMFKTKEDRTVRARQLLKLVGLGDFETAYPSQLSGGMQQRVNLARALAVHPEILLLDEPFAALDPQTREAMQDELLRIWASESVTTLLVTHQIEEAVYLSDRVVVFGTRPGRVIAEFPITLPRPRQPEIRQTPEFMEITHAIWQLVRAEFQDELSVNPQE